MQFKCPICYCPQYQHVVVPRERGEPYRTEFLCCLGCSAMFIDPELFTAATAFRHEMDGVDRANPRSPQAALQSQALRSRFWLARARALKGGWEPTNEDIVRLREKYRQ